MPATDQDWARGYARQALSDLQARDDLAEKGSEKCHRLHFLQMAAEKACKAYLTLENGHEGVRKTHAYVRRNLPIIARHFYGLVYDRNPIRRWQFSEISRLAKEIELLSPACDGGESRLDNSEYPWEDAQGVVQIPCEYSFPNIDDGTKTIALLVRLIRKACENYAR